MLIDLLTESSDADEEIDDLESNLCGLQSEMDDLYQEYSLIEYAKINFAQEILNLGKRDSKANALLGDTLVDIFRLCRDVVND